MGAVAPQAFDDTYVGRLLSQKKAVDLLEPHGWTRVSGGKHVVKMAKPGQRPITLPWHRGEDYGRGLTRAIRRQAGLD